jgi:hypothetical protein
MVAIMIFFTWKRLPISSSISDFVSIFEMSILIRRPEFFVDSVLWMFCRARHISGTLKKRSSQGRYNTSKKIRHSWAAFFQQHFYIFFVLRFFLPNRTFVKHFLQKKKRKLHFVFVWSDLRQNSTGLSNN